MMRLSHLSLLVTASVLAMSTTQVAAKAPAVKLTPLGSYRELATDMGGNPIPGVCRVGIAQIGAYDAGSQRVFVTNASTDDALDVLDISNPNNPTRVNRVHVADLVGSANFEPPGVAAAFGHIALAVEAIDPEKAHGKILLLDSDAKLLRAFDVGSGPERVAFSPDGRFVVAAVQGEKDEATGIDPRGGIAIIDLGHGIQRAQVRFADFSDFRSERLVASGIRIGPNPKHPDQLNPAVFDLEPHTVTVSPDSRTAFASLQLNNALAVVDLFSAKVTAVLPFGLKNHNRSGNGFDASKKDNLPNETMAHIKRWPVWGAYMPDGIAAFAQHGQQFLVTANEGDTRDDSVTVDDASVILDPSVFPNASALKDDADLGGLEVSKLPADARPNAKGQYRRLVSFGARSIAVWTGSAHRIYDSGDRLERITADAQLSSAAAALLFNTTDDDNSFDNRSPRRGPQPLGVAVGEIDGRVYAFVGLRKEGGIIIADVTNASTGVPLSWFSTRNYGQSPSNNGALDTHTEVNCAADSGAPPPPLSDLGPEGVLFIPANQRPNGKPLLVVNYDTSGSTRIYQVDSTSP
jgi:2',3'-cyclic-nucleotide 2'-phosphodiesterase/3'-nucleotidase/5'-nucleotidase